MRIEHRTNAAEQGEHAARSLLAGDGPEAEAFAPVPYFWSDQYDDKIQVIGSPQPADETVVVDGSTEELRFVVAVRARRTPERCARVQPAAGTHGLLAACSSAGRASARPGAQPS